MVGYMSLEEQVDVDFTHARRRALFRRLVARLRNGPASDGLPYFEDLRKKLGVVSGIRVGRRVVHARLAVLPGTTHYNIFFSLTLGPPSRRSSMRPCRKVDERPDGRAFHRKCWHCRDSLRNIDLRLRAD